MKTQPQEVHLYRHRFYWLIAFLVLLVIVVALLHNAIKIKNAKQSTTKTDEKQALEDKLKRTDLDTKDVPTGFPVGLPLDTKAKVYKNYVQTTDSGQTQAVREYETTQEPDAIVTQYKTYFTKAGWKVQTTNVPEDSVWVVSASKGSQIATINVNVNSVTKLKTVEISILTTKATK